MLGQMASSAVETPCMEKRRPVAPLTIAAKAMKRISSSVGYSTAAASAPRMDSANERLGNGWLGVFDEETTQLTNGLTSVDGAAVWMRVPLSRPGARKSSHAMACSCIQQGRLSGPPTSTILAV